MFYGDTIGHQTTREEIACSFVEQSIVDLQIQ